MASNRSQPHSNSDPLLIWEYIGLTITLLTAAFFRLGWPGINSFSFDEARVSDLALRMAQLGDFAELGMQSSTGVPNFPGAVWIYAIPYLFSTDPLYASLFTGVISTTAVLGIWWLTRAVWDRETALFIAILFAAAPFMVFYSRSIWSQNLLPPLAILWALTAVHGISRGNGRSLALHAFLSGFIGQVHLAGIALALVSLWLGLFFRLWRHWKPVSAGIILGVLAAMPTIYTIGRYGTGAQADLATILDTPSQTNSENFRTLIDMGIGRNWEWLWLSNDWLWPQALETSLHMINWTLLAMATIGAIICLYKFKEAAQSTWQALNKNERPTAEQILILMLPFWAICAPLFFYRSRTPVFIQYQLVSVPALFLFMGGAFGWAKRLSSSIKRPLIGIAVVIAAVQLTAIYHTLDSIQYELVDGGMGTPLFYPQQAIETLKKAENPIVIHSVGNTPEFDGDAAVFRILLWDYPHRLVDGRYALLIPDQPASLLATFDTVPAWQQLTGDSFSDQENATPLPRRSNEPPYQSFATTGSILDLSTWETADVTLENGATLQNWRMLELENGRIRLETYWRLGDQLGSGQIQQFNHLYTTAMPDQPTHVSDASTSSSAWRAGDHLFTWAEFPPLSAENELIRFDVGMYTWPDLQRSPVLGRASDEDPLAPIQLVP